MTDMQRNSTNLFFICIKCKQSRHALYATNAGNVPSALFFLISPESAQQPAKFKANICVVCDILFINVAFCIIKFRIYAQHSLAPSLCPVLARIDPVAHCCLSVPLKW